MMKNFKPNAWFLPQPVIIIGTFCEDGRPNAMNAAWAGQWDGKEVVISLGAHATTANLSRNPEFTITFATASTMVAADYVGIVSAIKNPDKMAVTGWNHRKAEHVDAPLFTDFPMTLECRVKQKLDESETGCYIIAEIVNIVCDEKFLGPDGRPDIERMDLIVFDPIRNGYISLGTRVGNAFSDGLRLK